MRRKFGTRTEALNDRDHFHIFRHAHSMCRSSILPQVLKDMLSRESQSLGTPEFINHGRRSC
jgi:hypothetical protein